MQRSYFILSSPTLSHARRFSMGHAKRMLNTSRQAWGPSRQLYETHIPISFLQRSVLAAGSAVAALRDPMRGDMVAALGETTGSIFLRRIRDQMLQSTTGRRILRERPTIHTSTIAFDQLRQTCAPGTFGATYIAWLDAQGVTPDTRCPVQFVDDEELAYVMKRYREIHDFFHTLTGLGVSVEEEIALKWFEWAQTGLPMTGLSSLFGPLRLTLAERHRLFSVYVPWAIQCGANASPLMNVYYEEEFHTPIEKLREQLGITVPPSIE
ncbi:Ubiquinone biosynthesis protein [Apophysomyces ossiformis]|uniref:4-hydroxy-3-methoxy-5-polyprenylbenzoate decarboxylase n=1 Tax=Apophysomyces ossiformis TaxID=679940 RepID=A0A8H7BY83_9FUNG|nr:Ubiquinone biosynthesis protein [Apophysomyces ossiformis]